MSILSRLRVDWGGAGIIGPGVSTFYCLPGEELVTLTAFRTLWDGAKAKFPNDVSIGFPAAGDRINDNTGDIVDEWTVNPPGGMFGEGAGGFARGVGARLVWFTAGRVRNRRVRGSTFLVPLCASEYDTFGDLTSGATSYFSQAANTMLAAPPGGLYIWSKPTEGDNGQSNVVTSASCPASPTTLRTRRT